MGGTFRHVLPPMALRTDEQNKLSGIVCGCEQYKNLNYDIYDIYFLFKLKSILIAAADCNK